MAVSTSNRVYLQRVVVHFGLPQDYVAIVLAAIRHYHTRNAHLRPFLEEDLQDVAVDLLLELGGGPWRNARGHLIHSGAAEGCATSRQRSGTASTLRHSRAPSEPLAHTTTYRGAAG